MSPKVSTWMELGHRSEEWFMEAKRWEEVILKCPETEVPALARLQGVP